MIIVMTQPHETQHGIKMPVGEEFRVRDRLGKELIEKGKAKQVTDRDYTVREKEVAEIHASMDREEENE